MVVGDIRFDHVDCSSSLDRTKIITIPITETAASSNNKNNNNNKSNNNNNFKVVGAIRFDHVDVPV